jgi:hypothetical protein
MGGHAFFIIVMKFLALSASLLVKTKIQLLRETAVMTVSFTTDLPQSASIPDLTFCCLNKMSSCGKVLPVVSKILERIDKPHDNNSSLAW